jgi:hypothetical protein
MDEVRDSSNSEYYTPSSEPFRMYLKARMMQCGLNLTGLGATTNYCGHNSGPSENGFPS